MFDIKPLLLDLKSVVKMTGFSKSSIHRYVSAKKFPQPVRVGKKLYWRTEEIENWVLELPQE